MYECSWQVLIPKQFKFLFVSVEKIQRRLRLETKYALTWKVFPFNSNVGMKGILKRKR